MSGIGTAGHAALLFPEPHAQKPYCLRELILFILHFIHLQPFNEHEELVMKQDGR